MSTTCGATTPSARSRTAASGRSTRGLVANVAAGPGCSEADLREATRDLPGGVSDLDVCGTPFLAHVTDVDGTRVVSANSLADQQAETRRLARLSILAALVGVIAAAGLGWLVGRRAVLPLGDALASQRGFVADASHELRTPLAILLTRAQMIERGPAYDEEQRRELGQLVQDARVLTDLVNDMLLAAELQWRPTGDGGPQ